jgi:hypothetical protein
MGPVAAIKAPPTPAGRASRDARGAGKKTTPRRHTSTAGLE